MDAPDRTYGPGILSYFYNLPIYSDGVQVSKARICDKQGGNSSLWEPRFPPPSSIGGGLFGLKAGSSDVVGKGDGGCSSHSGDRCVSRYESGMEIELRSNFKICVINELQGIGYGSVYSLTSIDFQLDDKLQAVDSKATTYESRDHISRELLKGSEGEGLSSLIFTDKDWCSEISMLVHIIFGPPDVLYNINYNAWTHDYWGRLCSKYTFKYYKIDITEGFLDYLGSNVFYLPDSVKFDKYSTKSDSDTESQYSNAECESQLSEPAIDALLEVVSSILKKSPKCIVKYRNVFVLDGCWIINNSLTISSERDLLLLLNSSSKWRDCEYQEKDLYLIERNKIDPASEFRVYYIKSKLFCISQLHSHIKLPYLQEPKNRINVVNNIMQLDYSIQKVIHELNLEHCLIDIGLGYDKFVIDILPWGWNGPSAHEPILDWRSLRILYIASSNTKLEELFNCGVEVIEGISFVYVKHDNQVRNAPFGNNIHPDDISEIKYQFS